MLSYDIIVIGDVNVDLCTRDQLPFAFSELTENGKIVWEQMNEFPGGTGFNFAIEFGYSVFLIGKVGNDISGDFLEKWIKEHKIGYGISRSQNLPTGRAFITRDKKDIKLLIDNAPNANRDLDKNDIVLFQELFETCNILYISWYALSDIDAPRFYAVEKSLELTRKSRKSVVILDVVPHQIYYIYNFEKFLKITNRVDILISEVATMRRFLSIGNRYEKIDHDMVIETANMLSNYYNRFVLMWGPSGIDYELLFDNNNGKKDNLETGHAALPIYKKRGFGDRRLIEILRDFFKIMQRIQ